MSGPPKPSEFVRALQLLNVELRLAVFEERSRRGLSVREAAAEMGMHRSELQRFETCGARGENPTLRTLERIVEWLVVSRTMKGAK